MIKIIDKTKVIKKWKPIIESLKVEDERKIELMSLYAEYRQLTQNKQSNTGPITLSSFAVTQNLLPMEMKLLSKLKLTDKAVIMSDFNDDKVRFVNPHPMLKFTLSYEEIDTDIKLVRKNKINAINSGNHNPNGMAFIQRLDNMSIALIISDINERLKDGQILYIDQQIISNLTIITSKPTTMEIKVTYDVL